MLLDKQEKNNKQKSLKKCINVNPGIRDISGHNPLGVAIINGSSHSMFKLAEHTEAVQLHVKEKQVDLSKDRIVFGRSSFTLRKSKAEEEEKDFNREENFRYIDDDFWSRSDFTEYNKPTKTAPFKFDRTCPQVDSSFMLALKHRRYRLVDKIFSKHMQSCVGEMTKVKANSDLNLKWTSFVGFDSYMPLYLVWITVKRKKQRKEDIESRGLTRLPQTLIREIIKYT